ncbi:gamma-glutamyltransferase, partial [Fusobacterium polymorphum]
ETFALDGRGTAPKKATKDLFLKDGEVQDEWKDLGGQSVLVPGLLKTMDVLLKKYGTMELKEVVLPALKYAKEGFEIGYTYSLTMHDDSVQRKMNLSNEFK